jgi:hypothetical protein
MNALGQYKEEKRLTNEELAAELKEKLGRPISATGVEMMLARKEPPVPWLNALGISPKEPGGIKDPIPPQEMGKTPGPIKPVISLPFEPVSAQATIELIYTMAGKGAAMASKTPAVADAWHNSSQQLAEGWIEWAKENKTVANGIAMLTVGGPGGQVILMNASLLITTLMVIQNNKGLQIIPPGFDIYKGMSEEEIRMQTEQAADEQLRNTTPPSS